MGLYFQIILVINLCHYFIIVNFIGLNLFEATFNFPKPSVEEDTVVFTCKMGGRSQQAAQLAAAAGYKNVVNYTGGADDWFGGEFVYT